MKTWLGLALVAWGLWLGATVSEAANEALCGTLGANCICSEPLNTNSYPVHSGQPAYFNPADTTGSDKQCSGESPSIVGYALVDGSGFRYQAVNSGEAITNLPSGHTNTWILRTNDGGGGQFLGHVFPGSAPTGRRSIRFYLYYSSNYGWVGGSCANSNKIAQMQMSSGGGGPIFTETAWSFYAIGPNEGWSQGGNGCCVGPGPGQSAAGPSLTSIRGKWIRYELILRNATTSGVSSLQFYMKNVTDNTPEIRLVDTTVPATMADGLNWTSTMASQLGQTGQHDMMVIDWFRNGTCTGFKGASHYLAAAWATDSNQRIGAAVEIEGDGTPPGPAPILAGAHFYSLTGADTTLATPTPGPTKIGFIHTAAVLPVTVIALLIVLRRRRRIHVD
jgi:hypothetical protein